MVLRRVVVDAFWGDAGKGKSSACLTRLTNSRLCVRAGVGPNAGHSVWVGDQLFVVRQVPLGCLNTETTVAIGSGVTVDPDILLSEIERFDLHDRLKLDYRYAVIEPRHRQIEHADVMMRSIDSTFSGCGAARADLVMRRAKLASDIPSLRPYVDDVVKLASDECRRGAVIVEGTQGALLSLSLSDGHPYVTSDNCTSTAFLDDVGLTWRNVGAVVMAYPDCQQGTASKSKKLLKRFWKWTKGGE